MPNFCEQLNIELKEYMADTLYTPIHNPVALALQELSGISRVHTGQRFVSFFRDDVLYGGIIPTNLINTIKNWRVTKQLPSSSYTLGILNFSEYLEYYRWSYTSKQMELYRLLSETSYTTSQIYSLVRELLLRSRHAREGLDRFMEE